jgi:hypothetical protein
MSLWSSEYTAVMADEMEKIGGITSLGLGLGLKLGLDWTGCVRCGETETGTNGTGVRSGVK